MKSAPALLMITTVLLTTSFANAETLLIEFGTRITSKQIDIPEKYQDLNATFDSIPEHGDFDVRVIVPNFESYAKGTHTVPLNVGNRLNYGAGAEAPAKIKTPGLAVTLETKIFGALEGVSTRVRAMGSQQTIGKVILPDETQLADYGTVTIVDGQVTAFTYGWTQAENPGLASITRFLVERRKFPVGMGSLTIDVNAFSAPAKFGDLAFVIGLNPEVRIALTDASRD
ncbi:MAG: hypothetical protein AAGA03_01655 [Planctomycetota bacterium]